MRRLVALVAVITAAMIVTVVTANGATKRTNYTSWASWYGPGLYGNNLACGGRLYTTTWGVAHKYLRCGTKLRMCYSRCVTVTVIDRGPFVAGRDFDLTYPVKLAIGMPSVGQVRWWIAK